MINEYFQDGGREIILPIGVFVRDGELLADGKWSPSVFDYATGDFYEGRMTQFERATGHLLCEIEKKRSV